MHACPNVDLDGDVPEVHGWWCGFEKLLRETPLSTEYPYANQLGGGDCNTLASSLVLSANVQLCTWVTTTGEGHIKVPADTGGTVMYTGHGRARARFMTSTW